MHLHYLKWPQRVQHLRQSNSHREWHPHGHGMQQSSFPVQDECPMVSREEYKGYNVFRSRQEYRVQYLKLEKHSKVKIKEKNQEYKGQFRNREAYLKWIFQ